MKQSKEIALALAFVITCILLGISLIEPTMAHGQMRDPFSLPAGIHLLSKNGTSVGPKGTPLTSEAMPADISPPPPKLNAILISDRIRLASIDRHIVTVGDSIHEEKVLEIKSDRVILGKGDKRRTLLLSQSPIQLTVEEK